MILAELNQVNLPRHCRFTKIEIAKLMKIISKRVSGDRGMVSIVFVCAKEIRKLNRAYRGKDKETDVLSFLLDKEGTLGEILICYEVARRQAFSVGHGVKKEMIFLIVHGILHLLGFDHESPVDAKKMFALQNAILKAAGVKSQAL
jgi:probable rRNA maturation factor